MTIKMELSRSEILEIKTPYGTVLISYLNEVGLSVGTYTDPESNPDSAVHIQPDGTVKEIHCPKDEALWTES